MVTKVFNLVITGDASAALKALTEVGLGAEGAAAATGRAEPAVAGLFGTLESKGGSALVARSALYDLSGVISSRLGVGSEAAARQLDQLGVKIVESGEHGVQSAIKLGLAVAAILTLAEVAKKSVEAFTQQAEVVEKLHQVTNASAEDSSRLAGVLHDLGVSSESATTGFSHLEKAIGSGMLAQYGVNVARAKDSNVDFLGTLENVSQAYGHTQDASTKAAFATAVFGRGYTELLPVLAKSKDQLAQLFATANQNHTIYDDQQLEKAKEFSVTTKQFGDQLSKLEVTIGETVVPVLTSFLHGLESVGHAVGSASSAIGGLLPEVGALTTAFLIWLNIANPLWGIISDLGLAIAGLGYFTQDASSGIDQATASTDALTTALQDAKQAQDDLNGSVQDVFSLRSAQINLEKQTVGWEQQRAAAAKQRGQDEVAAETQIVQAKQSVSDAQRQVADTEQAAADAIHSAQERVASIQEKILDQQNALDTSARSTADAELKLARAEQDLAVGRVKGVDATRAVADAQESLTRSQQDQQAKAATDTEQRAQNNQDLIDAQHQLAEAVAKSAEDQQRGQEQVQKALEAVTTAQQNLTKAQGEGSLSALDLEQHSLDLEQAHYQLDTAIEKVHTDSVTLQADLAAGTLSASDLINTLSRYPDVAEAMRPVLDMAEGIAANLAAANAAAADSSGLVGFLQLAQNVLHGQSSGGYTGAASGAQGDQGLLGLLNVPLNFPHNAGGTDYWSGGPTMVGESGPEVLSVPRGASIIPHDRAGGLSLGGELHLHVHLEGLPPVLDPSMARQLGLAVTDGVHEGLIQKQRRGTSLGIRAVS